MQIKDDIVKRLSERGRTKDRLTTGGGQGCLSPEKLLSQIPQTNGQVEVCLRVECRGGGESCEPEVVSSHLLCLLCTWLTSLVTMQLCLMVRPPYLAATQDDALLLDFAALQLTGPGSHEGHGRREEGGSSNESKHSTRNSSAEGTRDETYRGKLTDDNMFASTEMAPRWDIVFKVTEALMRMHMGQDVPESEWVPKFGAMMSELRTLAPIKCNPSNVSETTNGSSRFMEASTLCEYINRVIQANDPAGIGHDLVCF